MTTNTIGATATKRTSLSYADCERIQNAVGRDNLAVIDKETINEKKTKVKRGQVYIADLGNGQGSEQSGIRPVLVIQNDVGNFYSNTVLIVPITSAMKKNIPTHMNLEKGTAGLTKDSTLIVEQMRTVDKTRLRHCIGVFSDNMMNIVDKKVMIQVGIAI